MAEEKVAISVKNISKDFYLPHEKSSSIKGAIVSVFHKKDKSGDTQHALRNVSFDIKEGEFFGILGRNGSGKSTLLKILAEIYQPTAGSVKVEGKLVPFIELGVGFNPELTGRENVYLNGALLGFSQKEIDERYDEIVQFAELEEFMDQKLKNYSSGMQVRLAFSVATRANADILLVDEVLAVGDADFQRKCYHFFQSLKKQKKTVVFVSHDMSAVREFCDRAVLIEDSRVIESGRGDLIAAKYSQLFLEASHDDGSGSGTANRWGDGRAKYTELKLSQRMITDKDSSLGFSATFTAKVDIDSIVAGSSLTNAAGEEYCGTNTDYQDQHITNIKKGERVVVQWEYPNIFTDGEHYINLSLHGRAGENVSDWWTEAAKFKVKRKEKSPFVVTPPVKVAIKR